MKQNKTLDYYNQNAEAYIAETGNLSFAETEDRFIDLLPPGAKILDFGCGSGRDSKYFHEKGFLVDAVDGSEEMCKCARQLSGLPVRKMLFSELAAKEEYDGIWACSSILHLPKEELRDAFQKMVRALKSDGIVYTSFKYGELSGMRNGRYFTDFTKESFKMFVQEIKEVSIKEVWVSKDVRQSRKNEKWLNLILQKQSI